jgi:hypothetical protein
MLCKSIYLKFSHRFDILDSSPSSTPRTGGQGRRFQQAFKIEDLSPARGAVENLNLKNHRI